MSMELLNRIKANAERIEAVLKATEEMAAALHERMDRIEYRKKPGPKPRRLQGKMND